MAEYQLPERYWNIYFNGLRKAKHQPYRTSGMGSWTCDCSLPGCPLREDSVEWKDAPAREMTDKSAISF